MALATMTRAIGISSKPTKGTSYLLLALGSKKRVEYGGIIEVLTVLLGCIEFTLSMTNE